jgi:hypothetical protein
MIVNRKASDLVQLPSRDIKDIKTIETAIAQAEAMRPKMLTPDEVAAKAERNKARQGRFAWAKLHGYRGCDPQWLDIWQYLIPARCDCKDGYQKILEQMPPDFSSPEAFFAWGVRLHNAVNAKLGKQQITLDEAYLIWRMNDAGITKNSGTDLP